MNQIIFKKISTVYRKYSGDSSPKPASQMCLLWSGDEPPDILENTDPLNDLGNEINFGIAEDDAVLIFDMNLAEATDYIEKMITDWEKENP